MPTRRVSTRILRVSTRIRRTTPRQGPRSPMHLVERMVRVVSLSVSAYIDRLMRQVEPILTRRFDATESLLPGDVPGRIALGEQFLRTMFHAVDHQAAIDLARVAPLAARSLLRGGAKLERHFIELNTELLDLDDRALEEVSRVLEGALPEGIRVEEVRQKIEERLGIVRARAEFIARDQTLKLYGQVQEARQTDAGIEEYTWSTSEDERVRPRHQALDGTTQRWDSPPIVDEKTGRRAHPGGDYQCRCAAIPILPLDGESEDTPESGPGPLSTEPLAIEPAPPENDTGFAEEAAS